MTTRTFGVITDITPERATVIAVSDDRDALGVEDDRDDIVELATECEIGQRIWLLRDVVGAVRRLDGRVRV